MKDLWNFLYVKLMLIAVSDLLGPLWGNKETLLEFMLCPNGQDY
jgi:hypothetical protein